MKYAIFIDDGETTVMRLDSLDVIEITDEDIDRLYEMADENATLAEIRRELDTELAVGQTSTEKKPDFRDNVEHVYDVKVAIAVGLNFDEPPTEEELKQAMWANFIEKATLDAFDIQDDDITYELLDVTDHMEGNE